MDASRFGGRLKELREQSRQTQKQLAETVGITVRQISRLETGVQEATWPTVVSLAEALGVDCRAFLEGPATIPEPQRGRPPKAGPEVAQSAPKRPRGRPRKDADGKER